MSAVDSSGQRYLCDCAVCGAPVFARRHQADSARTCKPSCARALAVQEHPEINVVAARELLPGAGES